MVRLSIPALHLLATKLSTAASASASAPFCAFADIFGAGAPPYYVTYKTSAPPAIDGSLDDPAWLEVPWTQSNPDICGYADPADGPCSTAGNCAKGCAAPRFRTRQKLRYDDRFLYVAAELTERQVWANNTAMQSVIFSDNDYEVFISPDGSNVSGLSCKVARPLPGAFDPSDASCVCVCVCARARACVCVLGYSSARAASAAPTAFTVPSG